MPSLCVYIKETTWTKIMRSVSHDRKKAIARIRELCEKEYGT